MDLAKIRKKYLKMLGGFDDEHFIVPAAVPELIKAAPEDAPVALGSIELDSLQKVSSAPLQTSNIAVTPLITPVIPKRVAATHSPLEIILAGRTAAGCDNESILADNVTVDIVEESRLEFLCFRIFDEIYGVNIMDIKEIIKPREVTEVPRAPVFVSGVLSLRGTIIPIIDMHVRLGLDQDEPTGKERIVVIKNNNSLSGLLVDEVIQVVQIQLDAIETAPAVLDGIDREFIGGIGRADGQLIIVLNLETIADINLY